MAWTEIANEKGYKVYEDTFTIADSAGANVVTVFSDPLEGDLSNTRFFVHFQITEASGANGDLSLKVHATFDDFSTYTTAATAAHTRDTSSTGTTVTNISLADYHHGKFRFQLQTDGTDILDSCDVTLRYSAMDSRYAGGY